MSAALDATTVSFSLSLLTATSGNASKRLIPLALQVGEKWARIGVGSAKSAAFIYSQREIQNMVGRAYRCGPA